MKALLTKHTNAIIVSLLALSSLFVTCKMFYDMQVAVKATASPKTIALGEVISINGYTSAKTGKFHIHHAKVKFQWHGQTYTTTNIGYNLTEKDYNKHKNTGLCPVYVYADNPEKSVLSKGFSSDSKLGMIFLPAVTIALGILAVMVWKKSLSAPNAEVFRRSLPSTPQENKKIMSWKLFATLSGGLVLIFVFIIASSHSDLIEKYIVPIIYSGISLILICVTIYSYKFKRIHLKGGTITMDENPVLFTVIISVLAISSIAFAIQACMLWCQTYIG